MTWMNTDGQRCPNCGVTAGKDQYGNAAYFRPQLEKVSEFYDNSQWKAQMACPRCEGVFVVYAIVHQIKAGKEGLR